MVGLLDYLDTVGKNSQILARKKNTEDTFNSFTSNLYMRDKMVPGLGSLVASSRIGRSTVKMKSLLAASRANLPKLRLLVM